jgi:hypothetical protein
MDGRLRGVWGFVAGVVVASVVGVGGFAVVRATSGSSSASSFVPVAPVRVLDTRSDLGLVAVTDGVARTMKITGSIQTATSNGVVNTVVVPVGATAVVLNVTAVNPTASGYVSLRPGDAYGPPTVSTLNVTAGGTFSNGATITIPVTGAHAGEIQVWFEAEYTTVGSTELLIDIAGYYELASSGPAGATGPAGPAGAKGDTGAAGAKGDAGTDGTNGTNGTAGASSPTGFTARSVCGASGTTLCAVGVRGPGGGTIVYVDSTNEMPGYDYLEVAPENASTGSQWSGIPWSTATAHCGTAADFACDAAFLSNAPTALGYIALGTGRAATAAIVAHHNVGGVAKAAYAAGAADAYTTPTASDWFLPSKDELNEVCKYARNTGQDAGADIVCAGGVLRDGFSYFGIYWSSSERDGLNAWGQGFDLGGQGGSFKYYYQYSVRPVRAF